MKTPLVLSLASVLLSVGFSAAQTLPSSPDPAPPNSAPGYYVVDGEIHHAWLSLQSDRERAKVLAIPPQTDYPEPLMLTPDQVSEWGFTDEKTSYVGARVDTAAGSEWFFMERVPIRSDKTSILCLSDKVVPVTTYYRVEPSGRAVEIGSANNSAPMFDYLEQYTGYRPSDPHLKLPSRLRRSVLDRYHSAFVRRDDKLFVQRRFGVVVGGGVGVPSIERIVSVAGSLYSDLGVGSAFSVGVFARFPIDGGFSLQPELTFGRLHSRGTVTNSSVVLDKKSTFVSNLVTLPLLVRINLIRSRSAWMPYFEAGPVVGFSFGEYRYQSVNYNTQGFYTVDKTRKLSSFTSGAALGVGAERYIDARRAAWFGVRASYGSNLLFRKELEDTSGYSSVRVEIVAAFSIFNF